jgi:hypothetical protein
MTEPLRAVLDTDTFNEIDDQFAVVYALLSPSEIRLEALYAAPFHNGRSTGPADGMLKSYDEIRRLLDRLPGPHPPVLRGSQSWLPAAPSPASQDLIARARTGEQPLHVLTIGAPTNVAAALQTAPDIAARIVVVWLGGNPRYWHKAVEFNVSQDMAASRVLLDSGVPLVHVPCRNVAEHVRTTKAEIDLYVRGTGPVGDYLAGIFADYQPDDAGRSKVLWDMAVIAWLVNEAWVPTAVVHSPLLTDAGTWSHDPTRHLIREALEADRDEIFADFFRKLRTRSDAPPAS